jgi:mannose-6-phosphate isomerase-like protein (cupin superfamily)
MKLVRRRAKCAWKDYKTNEDVLREAKNNPVVKKIQNYIDRLKHHARRMDRDRLTYFIMKNQRCGKRIPQRHSEVFWTLNGTGTFHEASNPGSCMIKKLTNCL